MSASTGEAGPRPVASRVKAVIVWLAIVGAMPYRVATRLLTWFRIQSA